MKLFLNQKKWLQKWNNLKLINTLTLRNLLKQITLHFSIDGVQMWYSSSIMNHLHTGCTKWMVFCCYRLIWHGSWVFRLTVRRYGGIHTLFHITLILLPAYGKQHIAFAHILWTAQGLIQRKRLCQSLLFCTMIMLRCIKRAKMMVCLT